MKKPRLYKWNLTEKTEGLLFFAQSLEELLFHHTLDSFKAPALNTHLNIFELQFLSAEIFKNKVKPGALKPVLEELENRIKTDPAIEDQKDLYLQYHAKIKGSIKHPDELFFSAKSLLNEIENNYWENLKCKIIETVPDRNQKKKILLLAICLASEIELRGYNKHFLYFMVLNFFFNGGMAPKKIDENTKVKDFLDTFDGELFEWQVVFRGCESFIKFKEHLEGLELNIFSNIPSSFEYGTTQKAFFLENKEFPVFLMFDKLKAKDRFQARENGNSIIDFFSDICGFHDHNTNLSWKTNCIVRKNTEKNFVLVKPPPKPMVRGMAPRIMSLESIDQTVDIMKGKYFDQQSVFLFRKALDYHRAAAETMASENQLVSLWAALEGFLPPPKDDEGTSRIEQLQNSLLPSLTLSYVEKIFKYTSTCLFHSGKDIRHFIEDIDQSLDFFDKTILLLTAKELGELRVCLYESLSQNPLLRYRCHWCHENFKSNKVIKKSITRHREKLSWHIQRIYTTRNQIVHSAQSLPYISTLIENLHSYFDILLNSVMEIGFHSIRKVNIYSTLKTLEINENAYLKELEGTKTYISLNNW